MEFEINKCIPFCVSGERKYFSQLFCTPTISATALMLPRRVGEFPVVGCKNILIG